MSFENNTTINLNKLRLCKKKKKKLYHPRIDYDFHKKSVAEIAEYFKTSATSGLSLFEAKNLLIKHGKNIITSQTTNVFFKLIQYIFGGFCILLWIPSIIFILVWRPIGNPPDPTNLGIGILLIVVIFIQAAFHAFQDWSSNLGMKTIKGMIPVQTTVIRNGQEHVIQVEDLVIGDLVCLNYDNKVPADIRITKSKDLKFDKLMLTGECEAIEGTIDCTSDKYIESKNIAFMTSMITNGKGQGIVVATGNDTYMGKITELTKKTNQRQTSLKKEVTRFQLFISIFAILSMVVLVVVWATWLRVSHPGFINQDSLIVETMSIIVAYIPTGLIGALTLSLFLVAKKMSRNNVLVKDLSVIETLSCVNVIASDKTGTLTQGKMTVSHVMTGKLMTQCYPNFEDETVGFMQLAAVAGLCNDAHYLNTDGLRGSKKSSRVSFNLKPQFINSDPPPQPHIFSRLSSNFNKFSSITARIRKMSFYFRKETANKITNVKGDPTDKALLKFSSEYVYQIENLRSNYSIIHNIPFNRKNKWMMKSFRVKNITTHNTTFGDNLTEETCLVFLKGAPDKILNKCKTLLEANGENCDLTDSMRSNIIKIQEQWCTLGQRVLLLCKKILDNKEARELCLKNQAAVEKYIDELDDFCFLGMVGLVDPPRENMYEVIHTFRASGIRVFMITGDYSLTAAAIAKEIGIFTNNEIIDSLEKMRSLDESFHLNSDHKESIHNNSLLLSGGEIENLTDSDWRILTKFQEIVFARTTPEQKLRLVKEFQHDDYIVGVTGNGLNDAPALKKANIGISMGDGSEIAMDASQMILLDSHFSSILIGIENGRLVFDNLRKVVLYLLSAGCMGEIVPICTNAFLGIPAPLSTFQMLVICVLTDVFPALSLMLEKPEKDLMKRPPRSKKDHLVNWQLILQSFFFIGILQAFFSHLSFILYLQWYGKFNLSDIFFVFENWKQGYKGYNKTQLDEFLYIGQTVTFSSLVIMQIFGHLFCVRTNHLSFFQTLPLFKKRSQNIWLFVAQFIALTILILIIFLPFINDLFKTRIIPVEFFFIPLIYCVIIFALDEIRKILIRQKVKWISMIAW